jgi:hypothetical protein
MNQTSNNLNRTQSTPLHFEKRVLLFPHGRPHASMPAVADSIFLAPHADLMSAMASGLLPIETVMNKAPATCTIRPITGEPDVTEPVDNEIRDFLNRAPKRFAFNGQRVVYSTHARLKWLADIARGTIDERINRRAGTHFKEHPWPHTPTNKARARHDKRRPVPASANFIH